MSAQPNPAAYGERVLVCRIDELAQAEVHAVHDICTHANVSLAEGELDGCTL